MTAESVQENGAMDPSADDCTMQTSGDEGAASLVAPPPVDVAPVRVFFATEEQKDIDGAFDFTRKRSYVCNAPPSLFELRQLAEHFAEQMFSREGGDWPSFNRERSERRGVVASRTDVAGVAGPIVLLAITVSYEPVFSADLVEADAADAT